jgi:putative copper resistance protein D
MAAWWLGAVATGAAVLLVAAWLGGAIVHSRVTGLPDAGRWTGVGLPVLRLVVDGAGAVTVGATMFAAFLLPGLDRTVGPSAYRLLRLAGLAALVWAAAGIGLLGLTVSDLLGRPMSRTPPYAVLSFALSVSPGQALALQAGLAAAVAVVSRVAISRTGAALAAGLALVALVPPAFTGHAAGAGNHQLAVSSLVVHVLAAALWAGGLVALLLVRPRRLVPDVAARYSRLALVSLLAVAASGVANAAIRLGGWGQLWHSAYGLLVLGKLAALAGLAGFGLAHRRWSLRRLAGGRTGAFVQLAAAEVLLLAATFGLAVALSRTPTPASTTSLTGYDPFTELVGFALPPPLTLGRLLGQPLPDLMVLTVVVGLGLAYLGGVRRLHRAGHRWPWTRTAAWLAGLAVLAAATNLGVARYAYLLFSVHMGQHMVLSMVVPGLLVAGAPVTLALRTLREPSDKDVRGARAWLLAFLHSRYVRLVGHPLVALGLYAVPLYGLYFSGLFAALMRSHLGHLAMIVHFVLSGYLLTWVLVGTDPGRRRWPAPMLMLVLFAAMVFHALFGVALMQSRTVVGDSWYALVYPPWADPIQADQALGAGIAWAFGEIPAAVLMVVLFRQWMLADEREQRRLDRAADRAGTGGPDDALARYNEFLRRAGAESSTRVGE